MDNFTERLLTITSGCRDDMHEPDEQGVSATMAGYSLDNAMGDYIDQRAVTGGYQEYVVIIKRTGRTPELFNLASLIALARIGAASDEGKRIFDN
jgi:hypothetical protein